MATKTKAPKGKQPMTTFLLSDDKNFSTFIEPASNIINYEPHPSVQRGLDTVYANNLKRKLLSQSKLVFSPLGTILTIQRDGVDYVFDGQHRLQAIKSVAAEKEALLQAYDAAVQQKEAAWAEFNQRVQNHPDTDAPLDEEALKKTLGFHGEVEKPDTAALDSLLASPVVIVRYVGDWEEGELKELFTCYNMGKRVSSNLLTTFKSSNEMIVNELVNRGWLGQYIEDKGGKNKCLFGIGDVCRFVKLNGEATTLAFLEELFKRYDEYDAAQRAVLEPVNLYTGWSRSIGTSVRTLTVIGKLIPCINVESERFNSALSALADAAQKLMADPVVCASLIPGIYVKSANGLVQAGATVVEGLLTTWFVWQLKTAGYDVVLPKSILNRIITADNTFTELTGFDGTVTPIADVIEVFSTLAPKPKTKTPKAKATPTMVTPNMTKESLVAQVDLNPNEIAF